MSFQRILAFFFTFAPPGPGFIFRIIQQGKWGGGNTPPKKNQMPVRLALHSSRPLKNPECKPLSFCFYQECTRDGARHTIIIYLGIIFLMSAMALRSVNLPGVGTKYEIETDKGDTIAIFFTKTGTIQMYTLQNGCQTPSAAVMTPIEARRLGNILTGAIIEADKESVEIAFSALADLRVTIHTFYIPKSITGKTIEDLQIRAKTGATIIAVCRHDKNIINPPPAFIFETGDAALVIGESDQIDKFEKEIMVE
jgi:TrkA domain protein